MTDDHLRTAAADLADALLRWFDAEGRDLPWRRRRSLYGTWISEMMLQQTTVAAVVPYWQRFLARFPDVAALAEADEAEVLQLWSGLGYYRRARQLHAAARQVVAQRGGRLPDDHAGWLALPGVGEYAAGAIASLGLGCRVPALDANARRVLLRWSAADAAEAGRLGPARLRALGSDLVPAGRPGAWNEALMELGATVCRARDPRCPGCPLLAWCRAGQAGTAAGVPAAAVRPAVVPVVLSLMVVRRGDALLLLPPGGGPVLMPPAWGEPARSDLGTLHRGLWALPGTAWYPAPASAAAEAWRERARAAWAAWAGARAVGEPRPAGRVGHAITRYRLAVEVMALSAAEDAPAADLGGPGAVWAAWPAGPPVSQLVRKVVARESHGSG